MANRRFGWHSGSLACKDASLSKGLSMSSKAYAVDGVYEGHSFVLLDASSNAVELTIPAPLPGKFLVVSCVDASNAVTAVLSAGTYDGTNVTATFDAAEESLVLFGISATRFIIVSNIGAVALS